MRRNLISKKLISQLWHEFLPASCLDIVTTCSFCLKLQQKNLSGQKSTLWNTALVPQYLLARMLSTRDSVVNTFAIFSKSDSGFHWNGLSVCVFTNLMDNSAQLKTACFIFVNHTRNTFFSSTGMCRLCLFFWRTVSFGKNPIKICQTVRNEELTVRPRDREWKRVTHGEAVRVERSATCLQDVLQRPLSTEGFT